MSLRILKKRYIKKRKLFAFTAKVLVVCGLLTGIMVIMLIPRFVPNNNVQAGLHSASPAKTPLFADVGSGHSNFKAINYLKQYDIVEGYPDGTFQPDRLVTRAELLKFLFEAQKIYPSPAVYRACFKDIKDQWYAPYICYAKAKNLLEVSPRGKFGPAENVKVAEALKIIFLAYNTTSEIAVHKGQLPDFALAIAEDTSLNRAQLAEIIYRIMK